MRRKFLLRVVIYLFFLFGLVPANSCRNPTEPSSGVVEVSREDLGVKLVLENAIAKTPAKISVLFKAASVDSGLTKLDCDDFKLFEDGAPISVFEDDHALIRTPQQFRMHTLLLLDVSGSIVQTSFKTLKEAATALIVELLYPQKQRAINLNIDISVFSFDGSAALIPVFANFTADTSQLLPKIRALNEGVDKSTNLNGAVVAGINRIKTQIGKVGDLVSHGALVIFTDGTDRAARVKTEEALAAIHKAGQFVSVYSIGLKGETNLSILQQFGKDDFVFAETPLQLVPRFVEIARGIDNNVRSRYLIEYCSPKRKGRHELKIVATFNHLYGSLTVSFPADNFSGGCEVDSLCRN